MNGRWTLLLLALLTGCGYQPRSPLARAAFEGDVAKVRQILESRYREAGDLLESLVAAARSDRADVIRFLVHHGAKTEFRSGINEWTPLQHAIHRNAVSAVAALLDAGADPNTGLMMAAGYGQSTIVQMLLRRGADPARIHDGRNAMDVAVSGVRDIDRWTSGACQTETVRVLLAHSPRLRPVHAVIPEACLEIARMLLPETVI